MTTETTTRIDVDLIAPLDHDAAMALAAVEVERLLDLVGELSDDEWEQPTECPGWTVRDVLAHLLGMWKLQYDPEERTRQITVATQRAQQSGRLRIDELTALQVADHTELPNVAIGQALRVVAPLALAGRREMPATVRAAAYDPLMPGEVALDPRLPVRHHPHARPLDAPRRHLPGPWTGDAAVGRPRQPANRRRRGRLGAAAWTAVHPAPHRAGWAHVHHRHGRWRTVPRPSSSAGSCPAAAAGPDC